MLLAYHKKDRDAIILLLSERRFIVLADPNKITEFYEGEVYEDSSNIKYIKDNLIIFNPKSEVAISNDISNLELYKKHFTVEII